jgi:hypothetical protein
MVNLTVKDTSGNLSIRFVGISDTNTDYADPDGFWLDDFNITYSPQGEEAPPVSTPVPYPFRIGARSLSIRSGVLII